MIQYNNTTYTTHYIGCQLDETVSCLVTTNKVQLLFVYVLLIIEI